MTLLRLVWIQASLSSVIILGLGGGFHRGMLLQARHLAANMDTLISLGTLAAPGAIVELTMIGHDGKQLLAS